MSEINLSDKQFLTYVEAAQFLHISERHVWQLVKDGHIPCIRLGRCVRLDIRDLQAFAQAFSLENFLRTEQQVLGWDDFFC